MRRRDFLAASAAMVPIGARLAGPAQARPSAVTRPNILLVYAEDIGPALGCYGEALARTPALDRFARTATRFATAFTTAPVCSPSRTAVMTGVHATSIGAHNHRPVGVAPLPAGVRPFTDLLRDVGYYTANVGSKKRAKAGEEDPLGSGKTDLNFAGVAFDGTDWRDRAPGQPFFAQVTLAQSHRSPTWADAGATVGATDPARVRIPAYYPDTPVVRQDLANYHDAISLMDRAFARVIERLEQDGVMATTAILFMGDNGAALVRAKQFLYDGGIHVPLIIRRPGGRGTVDRRLVSGLDIAPTILGLAGVAPPPAMQGQDLFSPAYRTPDAVFAARDRCDVAVDRIRCVRTSRYKYIRNYLPGVPYMQANPYMERSYPVWAEIKRLDEAGRLTAAQALFAAARKPIEELYDLSDDPDEVHNLAADPAMRATRDLLRARLDHWVKETGDRGGLFEDPLDVFDSYFGARDPGDVRREDRDRATRAYGVARGG